MGGLFPGLASWELQKTNDGFSVTVHHQEVKAHSVMAGGGGGVGGRGCSPAASGRGVSCAALAALAVASCVSPRAAPPPARSALPNAMSQQHLDVFFSTVIGSSWQDQVLETQEASSGKYFNKTDSS